MAANVDGTRIEYKTNNADVSGYDCSMEEIKLERGVSFILLEI